jgi:outer membrane protein assembly factor BamB
MTMKRFAAIAVIGVAALSLGLKCTAPPNVPDKPWSPDFAMKGVVYSCSTKTIHPDGKQVEYQFDWGDGSQSEWSGLMDGGKAYGDTHTYNQEGQMSIRARARASGSKETEWSEPFSISVNVGAGQVRRSFTYTDPEDPEDSAGFSLNTFAIGTEGSYIGCEYGRMLARDPDGSRRWEFPFWEFDEEFATGVAIGEDGTAYIGCLYDTLYAVDPSGNMKWSRDLMGEIWATAAIGADGAVFIQSEGGVFACFGPGGEQRWIDTLNAGGKSSPVIGTDGTVYGCTQEGLVVAFDPSTGAVKGEHFVGSQAINASPALDPERGMLYAVDEEGKLDAIKLPDMSEEWTHNVGFDASSIVIGDNGRVYASGGGSVYALDANSGTEIWKTLPDLYDGGTASTPAVSESGYVYVLFSAGKKDLQGDEDSLYALDATDGSRVWAAALGEGVTDDVFSSPKIDDNGFIYIGSGLRAWIVGGIGGPAQSAWPMFQRDARSTGRAR